MRSGILYMLAIAAIPAWAVDLGKAVDFDVPPQALSSAILEFSQQAKVQIVTGVNLGDRKTGGVHGHLPIGEALSRLLQSSGLSYQVAGETSITIGPDSPRAGVEPGAGHESAAAEPEAGSIAADGNAKDSSTSANVNSLGGVTITATRRREPVREVPMQVTVLPAETLERNGSKSLVDYIADQPGVDLAVSGSVGGQLSIRGVSTGAQTIPTVGVYVDDVATGSSSAYALGSATPLDMGMLDLNHIEILRGPQGTLYGAGAMGGLLKYVTNQPDTMTATESVRLDTSTIQGGGINSSLNAVVNVPIEADVAGLRVAAFHDHFGGYYNAVGPAPGGNVNRGNTDGGRFSFLLTPTRQLSINLTATFQQVQRDGLGQEDINAATGQPIEGDLTRRRYVAEPYSNRLALYGADVEYDFHWARLNAITSVQQVKIETTSDLSPVYVPVLTSLGLPVDNAYAFAVVNQNRFSQELRLTSKASRSIEWLVGAYLNRERGNQAGGADAGLNTGGSLNLLTSSEPSTYQEIAGYGDLTWHITRDWALTGGARMARNHQSFILDSSGALVGPPSQSIGSSAETSTTYLATLKYAIARNSNVYFRAASGYRPGGPNGLKPNTPTSIVPSSFQSDSLWSYELGYKADLLDKTLSVEGAVYDIEWHNLQQQISTGGFAYYTNASDARVLGSELALNWTPTKLWLVNLSASTIDAELTKDAPGLGASAGERLPNSARLSAAINITRDFTLAGHDGYAGLTTRYVGGRNAGFGGSTTLPYFRMPTYTLVDLQAGLRFQKFNLGGYVRNLTNRRAILGAGFETLNLVEAGVTQPRTIGLNLSTQF